MTPGSVPRVRWTEDERFVYVVTVAGVEALRRSAAACDSEWEIPQPRSSGPLTGPKRRFRVP